MTGSMGFESVPSISDLHPFCTLALAVTAFQNVSTLHHKVAVYWLHQAPLAVC